MCQIPGSAVYKYFFFKQMTDQGFLKQQPGFATIAIRAGQDPEKWKSAAVVPPIVTSTTFKQPAPAEHTVSKCI